MLKERSDWRGIFRFAGVFSFCFVIFALGASIISGWIADPRIFAAWTAISGGMLSLYIGYMRWRMEQRERDREIMEALRTEIDLGLQAYRQGYSDELRWSRRQAYLQQIEKASDGEPSLPTGLALSENYVFDNLKAELPRLHRDTIRCILSYYQIDSYYNKLIDAFNSGVFEARSADAKKQLIDRLFYLEERAVFCGFHARMALDWEIDRFTEEKDGISFEDLMAHYAPEDSAERALFEQLQKTNA